MLRVGESLPQGRAPKLVIQCQMVSPENIHIHISNTTQTRKAVFTYLEIYLCVGLCVHACVFVCVIVCAKGNN